MPQILVVGAGASGLAFALTCAVNGVNVRIIEKRPARALIGKATGVAQGVWRQLERFGLSATVIAEAIPMRHFVFHDNDELIGGCGLRDVDLVNRTALLGIFLGDRSYWGKGYGVEATRLLVDFGFTYLNLNSIMLEAFAYNNRAIRCYEKVGFKLVGRRRQSRMLNNHGYDEILMDILAGEFDGSILGEAIPDL